MLLRDVLHLAAAQPDPPSRRCGRVIHAGLEAAYRTASQERDHVAGQMLRFFEVAIEAMRAHPDAATLTEADWSRSVADVRRTLAKLPVPHPAAILGVELPFTLVTPRGVELRGIFDLVLRIGQAKIHIRDWKSGQLSANYHAPTTSLQAGVYHWAASQLFPWAKSISVGLLSTRALDEIVQELETTTADVLTASVERDAIEAYDAQARLPSSTIDLLYPPSPGEHCGGCGHRSYCPVFAGADLPVRDGVDLAAERARLTSLWSAPVDSVIVPTITHTEEPHDGGRVL